MRTLAKDSLEKWGLIDWHLSTTKLSNMVTVKTGVSRDFNYYPQPDGSIQFGMHTHGNSGPFEPKIEQMSQSIFESFAWIVYKTDDRS